MTKFEADYYKPELPARIRLYSEVQDVMNRGQRLLENTYGIEPSHENGVQFTERDCPLKIQDSDTANIAIVCGYDRDGAFDIIKMQLYRDGSPYVTEKDIKLYADMGVSQYFNYYDVIVSAESPPLIMNEDVTDQLLAKMLKNKTITAWNTKNLYNLLPILKEGGAVRELDESESAELCDFLESAEFDLEAMQSFHETD